MPNLLRYGTPSEWMIDGICCCAFLLAVLAIYLLAP